MANGGDDPKIKFTVQLAAGVAATIDIASLGLQILSIIPASVVVLIIAAVSLFFLVFGWRKRKEPTVGTKSTIASVTVKAAVAVGVLLYLFITKPPDFRIVRSDLEVSVKGDGSGQLIRQQVILVKKNLYRISESDFSAPCGLKPSDFKWGIRQLFDCNPAHVENAHQDIIMDTSLFYEDGRWLSTDFQPPLEPGKYYLRLCTLTVQGAFSVSATSDWLMLDVNFPVDTVNVTVNIEPPRSIVEDSVTQSQLKMKGSPIEQRKLPLEVRGKYAISWTRPSVNPGDRFVIDWIYQKGH